MEINLIAAPIIILVLFISYWIYRSIGFNGKIRKFIRAHGLKTNKKESTLSVEFLRQVFLSDNPQYQGKSTEQFRDAFKLFLLYCKPDEELEDGGFYVNPDSRILVPPPPTSHYEPLPDDFIEC